MAAVSITAANVLASSTAEKIQGILGETVTAGMPVYLKASDGKYYKTDANGTTEEAAAIGIVLSSGSANQNVVIATKDPSFTPGFTMTIGAVYVVGAGTAGDINPVADLTTGWRTCVLMVAKSTTQAVLGAAVGKKNFIYTAVAT